MATEGRSRVESVDLVRGVIMILMALDHTRDFFGIPGQNPTAMATTTVPLFFTRWITHFCAPVFFLLAGTGACLSLRRKSKAELSRFLLTRGLWLVFLDLVLVRCFGYQFNFDYRVTMLLVLWALGWSMVVLALLVQTAHVVHHDRRARHDRRAQSLRWRADVESGLVDPAWTGIRVEYPGARGVRGVSADPLGGCNGGRFWPGAGVLAGRPAGGAPSCCVSDWG